MMRKKNIKILSCISPLKCALNALLKLSLIVNFYCYNAFIFAMENDQIEASVSVNTSSDTNSNSDSNLDSDSDSNYYNLDFNLDFDKSFNTDFNKDSYLDPNQDSNSGLTTNITSSFNIDSNADSNLDLIPSFNTDYNSHLNLSTENIEAKISKLKLKNSFSILELIDKKQIPEFDFLSQVIKIDEDGNQFLDPFCFMLLEEIINNYKPGEVGKVRLILTKFEIGSLLGLELIPHVNYLTILDLRHNKLEHINPEALEQLAYLEELYLAHNKLEKIRAKTFSNFSLLKILDLSENNIKYVSKKAFENLADLESLNLSYNKLHNNISPKCIKDLKSLKLLELVSNKISESKYQKFKYYNPNTEIILYIRLYNCA